MGAPAPPTEAPPKPEPKADGEMDAFAKFFKRVGKDNLPDVSELPPLEPEKAAPPARSPSPRVAEKPAAKAKGAEAALESEDPPLPSKSRDKDKEKPAAIEKASGWGEKTAASIVAANAEEDREMLGRESAKQPEVWPRRAPPPEKKAAAPPAAKDKDKDKEKDKDEAKEEDPKASPKLGFGLPPPGTVT